MLELNSLNHKIKFPESLTACYTIKCRVAVMFRTKVLLLPKFNGLICSVHRALIYHDPTAPWAGFSKWEKPQYVFREYSGWMVGPSVVILAICHSTAG